jgi:hypothetical protein
MKVRISPLFSPGKLPSDRISRHFTGHGGAFFPFVPLPPSKPYQCGELKTPGEKRFICNNTPPLVGEAGQILLQTAQNHQ